MDPRVLLRSAALVRINLLGFTFSPFGTSGRGDLNKGLASKNSSSIALLMSPPGRGQSKSLCEDALAEGDQGDSSDRRRGLLAILRDISPPGMWPVGDDQDPDDLQRAMPVSSVHSTLSMISNGAY